MPVNFQPQILPLSGYIPYTEDTSVPHKAES